MGEFDGIRVNDHTLEGVLAKKESDELHDAMQQPQHLYKKGRYKYMDTKEKDGKIVSRRQQIVNVLLTYEEISSKEVAFRIGINQNDAATILKSIYESELGCLYMTKRRGPHGIGIYHLPAMIEDTGVETGDVLNRELALKLSLSEPEKVGKRLPPKTDITVAGKPKAEVTIATPEDIIINLVIRVKVEVV